MSEPLKVPIYRFRCPSTGTTHRIPLDQILYDVRLACRGDVEIYRALLQDELAILDRPAHALPNPDDDIPF